MTTPLHRVYDGLLRRRALLGGLLLLVLAPAAYYAAGVRIDHSVEQMFPVHDPTRVLYDRYKGLFPHDDTRAVVLVQDSRLWTTAGLRRLEILEQELSALPGVIQVRGPLSVRNVTGGGDESIRLARLFASADLPPPQRLYAAHLARTGPLFAYNLAHPSGTMVSLQLRLSPELASSDVGRRSFNAAADALLARHGGEFARLHLTGVPVIRGRYIELVQLDLNLLFPLAYLLITLLVALTFRNAQVVAATVLTIGASLTWTFCALRALDVPIGILTSFTPVIIIIISISDTVHLVSDFLHRRREGGLRHPALVRATTDAFVPCLLTELVIAAGFLSMGLVNITAIWEFGLVMAIGMLLTWLANVTVLPWVLSLGRQVPPVGVSLAGAPASAPRLPLALRAWGRVLAWIEHQVVRRPRRVVGVALAVLLVSALAGSTVQRAHFAFDDLWPDSPFYQGLRYAEQGHGGIVPLAILLEPTGPGAALPGPGKGGATGGSGADDGGSPLLEPAALRFLDEGERYLRGLGAQERYPIRTATSVATYLRQAHPLFVGPAQARADGGLPTSRALAAQELLLLDDGEEFVELLSADGRAATLLTRLPDLPAQRVALLLDELRGWIAGHTPPGYTASITGLLAISNRVYELLLPGLLWSFLAALGVTFAVFAAVLRSVRLALVGFCANVAPVLVLLGFMAALGIDLKPSTVLLFSMVLVIADDDTIQYLSRFRRRFGELQRAGVGDPHGTAAIGLLRELGLPMFVTSTSVALGFLLLTLSEFRATANLGLIAGLTLGSAVLADLFLVPLVIRSLKPKVGEGWLG